MPSPKRVEGGRAPRLDFVVTAEMIELALPRDSSHCMIAEGLKASLPHARAVAVDLAAIRYTDSRNGRRYIYLTPAPAQIALLSFDQGHKPEPFKVKGHAAQIIEPGGQGRGKTTAVSASEGHPVSPSESPVSPSEKRKPPQPATLVPNPAGGGTVPIKLGGAPPPLGPLAHGKGAHKTNSKYRIGRRREFGLRVMGR